MDELSRYELMRLNNGEAPHEVDADNGGGRLQYFLRWGCKGYENMSDFELIEEAGCYNLSEELEELIEGLTP